MTIAAMDKALADEIYRYIKNELNHSNDFDIATDIVKKGFIDSMGVLELISFLEKRYRVEIAFEDITQDNFQNVGAIVRYVKTLLERPVPPIDTANALPHLGVPGLPEHSAANAHALPGQVPPGMESASPPPVQ